MSAPRYPVTLSRMEPRARFEASGKHEDLLAGLRAAGMPIPERHNASGTSEAGVRVDWLGPRRFVVSAPYRQEETLGRALHAAFRGIAAADVVCITDMVATFQLSGAGGTEVLAQGTPIDTGRAVFAPGSATGTDLWGVAATLERPLDMPDDLRVTVDRSLAGYIEGWLMTAAGLASDLKPGVMLSALPPATPSDPAYP